MNKSNITEKQRRKEKENRMFNPSFVLNVKNNFGKLFFKIVKKKFRKLILYQRSSTKTQLKLVTVVLEIKSL